ncbi:GDA1/CD39 (nucleoside phosphatase) family [Rhizoctonia solani]|uniref:guanosine-diphosphatase n=1 Tax=Rhizoctonia solani TaxID=456999 RepID=A0A8H7LRW8_9AGAM|nr:GDA1/CD39 (nucleoside phosphatase) family [Rhizoctonia solani]
MIESFPVENNIAPSLSQENLADASSNTSQPTASSTSVSHHQPKHARMRSNGSNKYNALPQLESQASNTSTSGSTLTPLDYRDESRGGMRKFAWKKYAIGAAIIIGVVWLFGPRESRDGMWDGGHDDVPSLPPAPYHSFETDPDPTKTAYCTSPYSPDKKLVQFALMIDAGSTGSRIHVYKFNNCNPTPSLEYEVFKMIRPGLSSYRSDPTAAAQSLDKLLDVAVKTVPKEFQNCAPVEVKATAGLRLLGHDTAQAILDEVRARLRSKYPFPVSSRASAIEIMEGRDEGVYAWLTANYLLGTLSPSKSASKAFTETYAVLDLGGASTQIVFEPSFPNSHQTLLDGEHKYELTFAGRTHTLYQHSYLGYGLMQARRSVHNLVGFMWEFTHPKEGDVVRAQVANACLNKNSARVVELEGVSGSKPRNVTMVGADVGSFEACKRVLELVMAKDAICQTKPCSFNGVYQPSILDTFPTGGILALSYFYDRIFPLLPPSQVSQSKPITLPIHQIASMAKHVCDGNNAYFPQSAQEELKGRPESCLDMTFLYVLLRLGYEFDENRVVRVEKKVAGTELGWCLGAAIAMLDAKIECKA